MNRATETLARNGHLIDWVTRVVGIIGLAAAGAVYAGQQSFVQCQADVNEALVVRTQILTEATEQERQAERQADDAQRLLFTDPVLSKPATQRTAAERDRLTDLFRQYQTALITQDKERAEADKARAEHPVPPPPSQTCG